MEIWRGLENLKNFNKKLLAKNVMADPKLPLNNCSDSDDSGDQDSKLLPFDPDLLPNVPKQLPKVEFEPN